MATIGLYDIDFNHGSSFSLSLPLMKAYTGLMKQGHQVIMMKPYEKTGRYNKIFYFKDNPKLAVPNGLVVPTDKDTRMLGYGFYKSSGLVTPEIIESPPSFTPYDLCSSRIKNKTMYKSIKSNCIIDWREKDFTGARAGAGKTYINDRDFLDEPDWEELFDHYDNDIVFIHTIRCEDKEKILKFIEKPYGGGTRIELPATFNKDELLMLDEYKGISFTANSEEELFVLVFISKILNIKLKLNPYCARTELMRDIIKWNAVDRISFKNYMTNMNKWNQSDYLRFPFRLYLQQDPKKITFTDAEKECIRKLKR